MTRIALLAALVLTAACGGASEQATPAIDSAAPAMAPAPMDSVPPMDSILIDTTVADTTAR